MSAWRFHYCGLALFCFNDAMSTLDYDSDYLRPMPQFIITVWEQKQIDLSLTMCKSTFSDADS